MSVPGSTGIRTPNPRPAGMATAAPAPGQRRRPQRATLALRCRPNPALGRTGTRLARRQVSSRTPSWLQLPFHRRQRPAAAGLDVAHGSHRRSRIGSDRAPAHPCCRLPPRHLSVPWRSLLTAPRSPWPQRDLLWSRTRIRSPACSRSHREASRDAGAIVERSTVPRRRQSWPGGPARLPSALWRSREAWCCARRAVIRGAACAGVGRWWVGVARRGGVGAGAGALWRLALRQACPQHGRRGVLSALLPTVPASVSRETISPVRRQAPRRPAQAPLRSGSRAP